jgi:hypothetical protein
MNVTLICVNNSAGKLAGWTKELKRAFVARERRHERSILTGGLQLFCLHSGDGCIRTNSEHGQIGETA